MGQQRGLLTREERARITELPDQLIDRFVEHREATAEGEEERVKELAAEIDNLLREKEHREVGDVGIGSGPPAAAMGKIGAVETVEWLPGGEAAHKPTS